MTPIILSTTKPGVQLSDLSTLSMSSPISTIITPDSDITRYQETNYDILLQPSLIPTGRKNEQSPSGLSTLSLRRSERSIPLNYPSSEPRISSISAMRIWQSTPTDLSYTQLVEDEERSHGESLGITSVSSTFTSTPSPLIDLSLSPSEEMMEEINFCSLGQRIVPGEYSIRPPLRPWEKRKGWKHPAEREIVKFMNGEGDGFIEEWNEEYIDRMT
ncbi:hypothetical protein PILCRDRAFT_17317 [Piloderma croceum F 1598]|uniref:Uncharacterized protein n=1 Tax=Piloderma croceum (strain F 1598) TaxID=765440 RepID=A0A0C3B1Q7_PILCF|nr:hypothetical protein PILCRDRAFT_17317 [Piloderma croceum F 1598]